MNDGLVLYPARNMVVHEGWDEKATHAKRNNGLAALTYDRDFRVETFPEVTCRAADREAMIAYFSNKSESAPGPADLVRTLVHRSRALAKKIVGFLSGGLTRHQKTRGSIRLPAGFERIYHVHVRKTGGTSLNKMFLALGDPEAVNVNYDKLSRSRPHFLEVNDYSYVGWDSALIARGDYFYGFSHEPLWRLKIPRNTFLLTCLRDPVARIVSHYKMLLEYKASDNPHPSFEKEKVWLGESFRDFLERVPKEHLLCQLYMFSRTFDIDEAVEVLSRCHAILMTESMGSGVAQLNSALGLTLQSRHERKSAPAVEIHEDDLSYARSMLEPEYEFLKRGLVAHAGSAGVAGRSGEISSK